MSNPTLEERKELVIRLESYLEESGGWNTPWVRHLLLIESVDELRQFWILAGPLLRELIGDIFREPDIGTPIERDFRERIVAMQQDEERLNWLEKHWHHWRQRIGHDSNGWCWVIKTEFLKTTSLREAISNAMKEHP